MPIGWAEGSKKQGINKENKELFMVKDNFGPRTSMHKLTMYILDFKLNEGFQLWGESNSKNIPIQEQGQET